MGNKKYFVSLHAKSEKNDFFDALGCAQNLAAIYYDLNNSECTRYENISHYLGQNNSLMMSLYYPIVQFKANETNNPMTVIYRERMYHISRYTNKIDRMYLQKFISIVESY